MNQVQHDLYNQVQHLKAQAEQAEVEAFEIVASLESGFMATARMGENESLEHHREKALTITVYKNQRAGSASTSDLTAAGLAESLKKACSIADYVEPDDCSGLPAKEWIAFDYPDLELDRPWEITPQQALDLALEADQVARSMDKRIYQTDESVISTLRCFKVYANSHGFVGAYPSSIHGHSISLVAKQGGEMERDYESLYSHDANDLQTPKALAQKAVERCLRRLNAKKLTTRRCPVIFESRVARSLIRHFIGAISGTSLYRRTSFLVDHLDKQVFPEFVSIKQRPHIKGGYGSVPFDSQGVKTRELEYVHEGCLQHYVLGNYSANKLGMTTTGNAGGVFNLHVSSNNQGLIDLCQEMGTGLIVTELLGQGVNLLTGDYSRGAAGFWVEGGKIQYPVHEITVSGNLREMLLNIVAIGDDADPYANIHCGSILLERMVVAGND